MAHTPGRTIENGEFLDFQVVDYESGEPLAECGRLKVAEELQAAPETAAERDRLLLQLEDLEAERIHQQEINAELLAALRGHRPREGGKLMAHTPGPWHIDASSDHIFRITGTRPIDPELSGRVVAEIINTDDEALADASLIAAAPELLAALERVAPWLGKMIADEGDAENALAQPSAVIAKARGE